METVKAYANQIISEIEKMREDNETKISMMITVLNELQDDDNERISHKNKLIDLMETNLNILKEKLVLIKMLTLYDQLYPSSIINNTTTDSNDRSTNRMKDMCSWFCK